MPVLYTPNFCCNCGEKIERIEWNLLTSRRFCIACSSEKKAHDILPRFAVAAGALALMFGLGSLWTGSGRAEPVLTEQPVGIKSSAQPTAPAQPSVTVDDTRSEAIPLQNARAQEQARTSNSGAAVERKNADGYFCGALTKKGTPCSRKVKAKGMRCFQHEGRPEAPRS